GGWRVARGGGPLLRGAAPALPGLPPPLGRPLLGGTRRLCRLSLGAAAVLLEDDEEMPGAAFVGADGNDLEVDLSSGAVLADPQVVGAHPGPLLLGPQDRRAKLDQEPLARHLQDVEGRRARRRLEVRADAAAELD